MLLSAQCISSIGQILNQFVSQSVCHTKQVERSTDRSLPPIFTKLATKVESQEMWLPIGENLLLKNVSVSNISKMVIDTMLDSVEVEQETSHGLSICTITFDLG